MPHPGFRSRLFGLSLAAIGLTACATPSRVADEEAARLGFERRVVRGLHFDHVVYLGASARLEPAVHVYIGGDGAPLRAMRYRPPDPTPSDPLMLRLMGLDTAPSIYLGRPGHHGVASEPLFWTQGRYAPEVVESLVTTLEVVLGAGSHELALIGHSGGGALAVLMAERLPEVRAVVTLAGNLDTEKWTRYHEDAPLTGSLDPADRPPLPPGLVQIHAVGGRDRSIPPHLTEEAISRQPGARRRLFPRFDHTCCWESVWPVLLAELERELALEEARVADAEAR